ncbi:hypothetical protein H0A36_02875 [Endozoicomonas sp. SM1973]|uniref:Uncharacterized protein n=1 Tax=Spartinivicinus marinus TaxID=2994442 RepID=A0A853I6V0_9GAMM|nr:hypothetical protein [Spartinivicinus marinus]MCX4029361.1 hypothetical protein [Spartinivicinus marinus]NYZ64935.1 hypothetical protein [Spartinivicinus marinus]
MKKLIVSIVLLVIIVGGGGGAYWYFFASTEAKLKQHYQSIQNKWLADKALIDAIIESNSKAADWDEAKIKVLDDKWRLEKISGKYELINDVVNGRASGFVREVQENSNGLYKEVIVMNNKGTNVGVSDITSDYWQGDEAKWQETYLKGNGAIHIAETEFDKSTLTYTTQLSFTVTNPADQKPIGAITLGVALDKLK